MKKFSVLLLFITLACESENKTQKAVLKEIYIKDKKLYVKVAATSAEWERGLMFVPSLPDTEGMLFIFPEDKILSFWMKNTPIDLSIAFIDSSGAIYEIHDMRAYDETPKISNKPGKYALEVKRGWFAINHINIGDTIKIPWIQGQN
ncbi:MAG: DUF192 domain-containing protein [candidate division WOR-3 bacterium]